VEVGSGGRTAALGQDLWAVNRGGTSSLTLDDSADTSAPTITLDTYRDLFGLGTASLGTVGTIAGLSTGSVRFTASGTSGVRVATGRNATVNVRATAVPTALVGHGPTSVNVGHDQTVQDVRGWLNVVNTGAQTTLYVDDRADAAAHTAYLGGFFDTYGVVSPTPETVGYITGLAPALIGFNAGGVRTLSIWAHPHTRFAALSPVVPTFLNGVPVPR
jgi:hypothetical protein